MASQPARDPVGAQQYVTVVLRLVVAASGRLLRGELVDVEAGTQGWFHGWRGMNQSLRSWLLTRADQPTTPRLAHGTTIDQSLPLELRPDDGERDP